MYSTIRDNLGDGIAIYNSTHSGAQVYGQAMQLKGRPQPFRTEQRSLGISILDGWIDRKVGANWEMILTLLPHFL